jgi:hypothetical protein
MYPNSVLNFHTLFARNASGYSSLNLTGLFYSMTASEEQGQEVFHAIRLHSISLFDHQSIQPREVSQCPVHTLFFVQYWYLELFWAQLLGGLLSQNLGFRQPLERVLVLRSSKEEVCSNSHTNTQIYRGASVWRSLKEAFPANLFNAVNCNKIAVTNASRCMNAPMPSTTSPSTEQH